MRSSVHHVSHKLWQRKFLNKHLRFPIHDFHPFVHPPLVSKSYARWVGRTWLVLVSAEWESALTTVFRVPVCSRTNTDSVLYLFLTCTRPPDSDADHNQLVIASQLHLTFIGIKFWAECNIEDVIPSSSLNHFVRSTSNDAFFAEVIYWCNGSIINTELQRLCSRAHVMTRFDRLVQSKFRFLR
jgi:hypothetical protein